MTVTRRAEIGNQIFASLVSQSRNEMTPIRFAAYTAATQTADWIVSRRKFMSKCVPETTYLLTTVIMMDAPQ